MQSRISVSGAKPLTYAAFRAQIDTTIHSLNELGVGRGDRVAIVLPNGPDMATAFVSVASAAAAAPLNPGYRHDEFDFYMSDINTKALIVEEGSKSPAVTVAQERGIAIITLKPEWDKGAGAFSLSGTPARRDDQGRPHDDRRRVDHPAHVGHDLASEDRAADAAQCRFLREQHCERARAHGRGSRAQRAAAVPHPWADRRHARAAVARRVDLLHAGLQRAQVLPCHG